MSFNNRLFSVDDYMPVAKGSKKRSKGIDRNGDGIIDDCMGEACGLPGYGKNKTKGFEAPGFFGGLKELGGAGDIGIETGINEGLPIQELGAEYNTRFGKIGTGFTEAVDPYQIGFRDILTGNGRTGEIIEESSGYVTGRRGRGRPKGSTKRPVADASLSSVGSLLSGGRGKKGGKSAKGAKFGKAIIGGEEGESVSSKYIEPGIKKLGRKIKGKLRPETKTTYYSESSGEYEPKSRFSREDIEAGRDLEKESRQRLQEALQREIEEQDEQPYAKFGKDD